MKKIETNNETILLSLSILGFFGIFLSVLSLCYGFVMFAEGMSAVIAFAPALSTMFFSVILLGLRVVVRACAVYLVEKEGLEESKYFTEPKKPINEPKKPVNEEELDEKTREIREFARKQGINI